MTRPAASVWGAAWRVQAGGDRASSRGRHTRGPMTGLSDSIVIRGMSGPDSVVFPFQAVARRIGREARGDATLESGC